MSRRLPDHKVRAIQRAADAGTLTLRELAAEFGVSLASVVAAVKALVPHPGEQLESQTPERGEQEAHDGERQQVHKAP